MADTRFYLVFLRNHRLTGTTALPYCPYMKWRVFIESPIFSKLIGDYLDDDDYSRFQRYLLESPKAGNIIRGSGGVRKVRWASRGKGKRGGIRVIYYIPDRDSIWLLTVYSKGEADTIPGPVLKQVKEAMEDD